MPRQQQFFVSGDIVMPPPETGEEGEKAKARRSGKAEGKPAKSASPRKLPVEAVRLAEIDLTDKTFQLRVSSPSKDLLTSLADKGQRQPIDLVGAGPPYRIVDGFQRVAAARKLGWDSVKAFVHRDMDEKAAMRIAFTKKLLEENLSVPEQVHAMALASRHGLGRAEIAELFGLSERQVRRYMKYLSRPDG